MSIYQALYDLIELYVYGGNVELGSHMDLICTLISTIGCLFIVFIPFIVVWRVLKLIVGGWQ